MERREFLSKMAQAGLYSLALGAPSALLPSAAQAISPVTGANLFEGKAKSVILIWLAGGMAHTETFDPKPVIPFEVGMDSRKVLSTFASIPTAVDGVQLSEGLEGIASVLDRGALVRSLQGPDLGPVLHTRHQYHWHTGYVPPLTVLAPHMGAWIAKALGPRNDYAPPFVEIGQGFDFTGAEEVRAFFTAGFLGSEFSPLHIENPLQAMSSLEPPTQLGRDGLKKRLELFKKVIGARDKKISDFHQEAIVRSVDRTSNLLFSPTLKAFQLDKEPASSLEKYNTGRFGMGCLLARRLVEAGTRFVELTSEYIPFGTWDTHKNGHKRTGELKKMIDRPIAQLVLDLEDRGLLDETLIVVASEFSRVAGKNPGASKEQGVNVKLEKPSHYGLHRHFIGASSVALFGGGINPGAVYGETANEFPCGTIKNPCTVSDVHATIYQLLGIPRDFGYEVEARPFYVTKDGKGKPIAEIIA